MGARVPAPASGSTRPQLTYSYATHHRHTCIARARRLRRPADRRRRADVRGQRLRSRRGDAPARADGRADQDRRGLLRLRRRGERLRDAPTRTPAAVMPDPVFANIGKLLLADADLRHAPARALRLGRPDRHAARPRRGPQPGDRGDARRGAARATPTCRTTSASRSARFLEDLTASYQGGWYSVISLHGGGSPAAMKQEIWRNYPVGNKVELVERLLESRRPAERPGSGRSPPTASPAVLRHRLHAAASRRRPMVALPASTPRGTTHLSRCPHRRGLRRLPSPLARRSRRVLGRAGRADRLAARRSTRSATTAGRRSRAGSSAARPTCATTRSTATWRRAPTQHALIYVSTETGERARLQLRRAARRSAAHGRVLLSLGVGPGRPRADLHADDSGGGVRDAGLRAHRRDPFGGVRRLRQRQPGEPDRRRRAEGDRQRRCRQPRRQGRSPTSRCSTRRSGSREHKPAKVLLVDRGLAPMALVAGRDVRLRARCASAISTPSCPAPGSSRPTRATRSTPAARPASRRACSATPAATRWRWRRA